MTEKQYEDVKLHLLGPLQTNKAAAAVSVFDVIQTLDRDKLAKNLAREMDSQNRRPQIFIQVNTGDEPQKSGVRLKDVDAFIEKCLHEYTLPIVGLMCIPPLNIDPEISFKEMDILNKSFNFSSLSMGMSSDYLQAIQYSASHVRIGSSIFGERS